MAPALAATTTKKQPPAESAKARTEAPARRTTVFDKARWDNGFPKNAAAEPAHSVLSENTTFVWFHEPDGALGSYGGGIPPAKDYIRGLTLKRVATIAPRQ